jgi:hypothetical protein
LIKAATRSSIFQGITFEGTAIMMNKLVSFAAGTALLLLTGTAYAGPSSTKPAKQPTALSDNQMDHVTAGGAAVANGVSITFGEVESYTFSQTSTDIVQGVTATDANGNPNPGRVVLAQAWSTGVAVGGFLYNAASQSHADATASWAP